MKNSLLVPFLCISTFLFHAVAFAADGTAPDLTMSILALWKAIQDHSATALILVPVFQILRTNEVLGFLGKLSGKYLQVVLAGLTTAGFVVDAWAKGQSLGQSAITGLFTAGGAMLIYEAIRSIKNPAPKL